MKITAVIVSVLALSATSALAEGDCAAKYTNASAASVTTGSLPQSSTPVVVVAQDASQIGAPATVSQ